MNSKLYKLAKMVMNLSETATDKAVLISDSELAEGAEVFVEIDGELKPAEDGAYETEKQIITVEGGKVVKIEDKEVEPEPEPEQVEQEEQEPEPQPEPEPEPNAELEDLRNQLEQKDAQIVALQDEIAALKAEIEKLKQEPVAMSAEDKNKKENQKPNNFFPSFLNK